MAKKIREHYFGNNDINKSTLTNYSTLLSDVLFNYGIERAARFQSQASTGKTFYYRCVAYIVQSN